jgi:hypothetical protein
VVTGGVDHAVGGDLLRHYRGSSLLVNVADRPFLNFPRPDGIPYGLGWDDEFQIAYIRARGTDLLHAVAFVLFKLCYFGAAIVLCKHGRHRSVMVAELAVQAYLQYFHHRQNSHLCAIWHCEIERRAPPTRTLLHDIDRATLPEDVDDEAAP